MEEPMEREALAALIERMLHAEARTDAPPENEHGDWLYGGVGPTEFTKPDAHGWMAIVQPTTRAWTPKALVFWHEVVRSGLSASPLLAPHPAHSLARWPTIERAVQAYVATLPETTSE